jgi:rhodanese-related sulfurtransferase
MLRHIIVALSLMSLTTSPLYAVDYGGEKSHLFEVKYQVCVIPPQVNEAQEQGINVVDVQEAKRLYDAQARFYDARDTRHYTTAHITGAEPVYFDRSKAQYVALNLPAAKETPIVFYCYGESCASSYEAALAVRSNGYSNVHWFLNGFEDWTEQGYPVNR